jgi:hypothetical protein
MKVGEILIPWAGILYTRPLLKLEGFLHSEMSHTRLFPQVEGTTL